MYAITFLEENLMDLAQPERSFWRYCSRSLVRCYCHVFQALCYVSKIITCLPTEI